MENDHAEAICHLGLCYQIGRGVDVDLTRAVVLFRKSIIAGSKKGMERLAYCYEYGLGVEKNKELAKTLYEKASRKK